jgi:predicted transcriptional regulator
MIIRLIAQSRSIEIDDPNNFRAFSVRVEGLLTPAEQDKLLGGIAVKQDGEHAWISEQALRDWPRFKAESWWQEGLTGMIAAVQKYGWIDNDSRSIRAHIEHAP